MAIAFLISLLHLKTKSAAIQVILYLIIIPLALHKLFATFSTPSLRWGELDFGGLEQITTPCYATRSFAIFLCFRTFLTSPSSRLFFFIIIMLPPKLSDWLMTAAIGASTQPQEISTVSFNPTGFGRKVSGHISSLRLWVGSFYSVIAKAAMLSQSVCPGDEKRNDLPEFRIYCLAMRPNWGWPVCSVSSRAVLLRASARRKTYLPSASPRCPRRAQVDPGMENWTGLHLKNSLCPCYQCTIG